ncbi:MAG TPA: PspA/IM30 family protein [Thermodesulfobacteriota bacterium]|nr:PspA/IM30 family protein [Thermodesulfobacteriota bacterium]
MGLKNRIGVLLKSQFNYWLKQAEDPEKILDQAVEEMEEGLDRAKGKLAVLRFRIDEEKRLIQKIGEQILYWQKRAEEFLKDGMEENTKDAVRRRRILQEEERKLKVRHAEDEIKLKEMEAALKELENRVQMAKAKRNILIKNIRLGKGIRKHKGGKIDSGEVEVEQPFSIFRKMEERIEEEVEFTYLRQDKEKETWEKEEKLINEEVELLKKNIRKGGSTK